MARSFKRPFQPSISSYFGRIAADCDHSAVPTSPLPSPPLPSSIQSSLLNVGMRVRKAVPEGYKTRRKMSNGAVMTYTGPSPAIEEGSSHFSSPAQDFTGLVPYCGILKIGGHLSQPVPTEDNLPPLYFGTDDQSLPSSQESSMSSFSTDSAAIPVPIYSRNNKRRREDADDEDLGLESQPVSPRSRPISHTRMPNLDQVRPIALPKTRRKTFGDDGGRDGGRESAMIDVEDFGEAPFFRPEEWGAGWGGLRGL